tara:strand:+ start:4591 stop:5643 length:1053 start_codon:yes stop_codon:yes gene_type:complete
MSELTLKNLKSLNSNEKVSMYGAGAMGKFLLKRLKEDRPEIFVECFIDDIKTSEIEGIPIKPLSQVSENTLILITTSYWREVVDKLKTKSFKYFVVDLLSGKSDKEIISREINGNEMKFFTPNKYLLQVSQNFETIEDCTFNWINSLKIGSTFYDIGASSGIYAVYAAKAKGCLTVAIEPDAQNFAILEMNHHLNRHSLKKEFVSLNIGLGNEASLLPLKCQEYLAGAHGKVFDMKNRIQQNDMIYDHIQYVLVDSLDHLINRYDLPMPQYLKIDVDGGEFEVLKGSEKTLRSSKVQEIMIETDEINQTRINEKLELFNFHLVEKYIINEIIGGEIQGIHNYLYRKNKLQ